jgi:hypothetical protein
MSLPEQYRYLARTHDEIAREIMRFDLKYSYSDQKLHQTIKEIHEQESSFMANTIKSIFGTVGIQSDEYYKRLIDLYQVWIKKALEFKQNHIVSPHKSVEEDDEGFVMIF